MSKLSPDNHLSGSVMPAWLGLSLYQTSYDVLENARNAMNGVVPLPLDSLQVDIGTAVEPIILSRGLRQLGLDPDKMKNYTEDGKPAAKKHNEIELYYSDDGLYNVEEPITIYSNEAQDITVMNQDGEITLDGLVVLEAKYTTLSERKDDPPLHRGPIQLQAGMMCHNAKYGVLFTCYSGRKITAHVFERHDATIKKIAEGVAEFEQHMEKGTWPEPKTVAEMAAYYTEPDEEPMELEPDLIASVLSIEDANAAMKINQEIKEQHGQKLMGAMGNHAKATIVDEKTGVAYNVAWPFRKTKAKPAEFCPACKHELKPAVAESETRQKTISIRRMK